MRRNGEIMVRMLRVLWLVAFLLITTLQTGQAQPSLPQQTLERDIADLRSNPDSIALREKIIKHVRAMRPTPPIPEEARRYMARGQAAAELAKTKVDYDEAAKEFQKAVNIAPWWADAYYNLGLIQEKAERYSDAVRNLNLYMFAAPNALDMQAVQARIYKLEYRAEKAGKRMKLEGTWEGTIDQPDVDKYGKRLSGKDVFRIETDGADVRITLAAVTNVILYWP